MNKLTSKKLPREVKNGMNTVTVAEQLRYGFFLFVFVVCYFCIRQHDVNILTSKFFQRRARDDCVLRFFFLSLQILLSAHKTQNNQEQLQLLILCVLCFCLNFFCIRQHDVNILMQSFLEKRRDVCVLRFFSSFFSSCSSSSQLTS